MLSRWEVPAPCHDDDAWPDVKASAGVASSVYFEFGGFSGGGDDDDDDDDGPGWGPLTLPLVLPFRFLGW